MATSYETLEIISSHHAEVDRLCSELLELGSRVAEGPDAELLRERARALAMRLRDHLTEESAALLAEAGGDRRRVEELLDYRRLSGERLERDLAQAEQKARGPLELVNAVCAVARSSRATLDRAARP